MSTLHRAQNKFRTIFEKSPIAMEMGIGGFLMKPVIKSELATMVRRVLDEAKGDVET